jgi:diguanylate cyclase (GGDEF)-like protein/PAS domain S-box-containing protein
MSSRPKLYDRSEPVFHAGDGADRELRRLKASHRALRENPSYAIYQCDAEGRFLEVNGALVRLLGYSREDEVLDMNLTGQILANPLQRTHLLGAVGRQGSTEPLEVEWMRKDGTQIKVRLSAQEVFDDRGGLEAYQVIAQDVTAQRELEEHLRRQAASDPLTGLANYRQLIQALDRELRRSKRTGREFSLLLFDLDGLKKINDSYGHMVGSQALCRVADALTVCCRDIDTAARFGGDEFAVLLPETGARAAKSAAERIRANIAEDGNGPALSVSVGVAVYPKDGNNVDNVICAADAAMYAMKRRHES